MKSNLTIMFKFMLLILAFLLFTHPVHSAENAIILTPPLTVTEIGNTFDIHLALDSAVVDVMVYVAAIKYDTSIIRLTDAFPDTAWSNLSDHGAADFTLDYVLDVDEGTGDTAWYYKLFDIIWSTQTPRVTIDGYAEIATLRFEVLDHGASYLYFDTTVVKGDHNNIVVYDSKSALIYVCPLPVGFTFAGDADASGALNVADLVYMVNYIFKGGSEPLPMVLSGDSDCNLQLNVADLVYLVNYIFKGGPAPCSHCS